MRYFILVVFLFLGGCVNVFSEHYEGLSPEEIKSSFNTDKPVKTRLISSSFASVYQDSVNLRSQGYRLLGVSEFNTSPVSSDLAVEQGEKLTADIVVLYMQYTNTINTVMPITLPSTTTASTNYYNGYNNFIGSSQSTIYGQSTTYVPMVIDRYNYIATYWKKDNRKPKIGVVAVDLTDDLKGKLQTNSGCYVEVVIKDTPAFYADILRGDVIFSLNGTRIINSEHLNTILSKIKGGQQINLIIIRNGYKINKSIYLS